MVSKCYHFSHCLTEKIGSRYNASDLHSGAVGFESLTILYFLVVFRRRHEAAVMVPQIIPRSLRSTFCPIYDSVIVL
jgi:hypothetical protein